MDGTLAAEPGGGSRSLLDGVLTINCRGQGESNAVSMDKHVATEHVLGVEGYHILDRFRSDRIDEVVPGRSPREGGGTNSLRFFICQQGGGSK